MNMSKPQLFLAEDDLSFGAVLKSYLELNDFDVSWVDDGKFALDRFRSGHFDLCLLDVMLPNVDGFTIATEIRKIDSHIPFVFLTAKAMKEDVLRGYNVGADDYITKPFDSEVLICKIRAILNRKEQRTIPKVESYQIGNYQFNVIRRLLRIGDLEYKLTPKEAELLQLLCAHSNDLVTRETALVKIWGDDSYFTARSMDVYITKLRKYLAEDPSLEIKNLHGSGFMLEIGK